MLKRLKTAWLAFRHPELVQVRDALTETLNRQIFVHAAKRELSRVERGQSLSLSLAFLDLDNLKKINDGQGHKAGDLHLKEFAAIVSAHIRPYDLLARWGGDEFVLLLPGDVTGAEKTISRIHNLFPHFSWGISAWSKGADLNVLLETADAKMYRMKEKNKK